MSRLRILGYILPALVLLALGIVSHYMYERHLTGDFKRDMIAASDTEESLIEMDSYLHQARLDMRTKRDRELLERFEKAKRLMETASEAGSRVLIEMNGLQDQAKAVQADLSQQRKVEDSASVDLKANIMKEEFKKRLAGYMAEGEVSKTQMRDALNAFKIIRIELGLPKSDSLNVKIKCPERASYPCKDLN